MNSKLRIAIHEQLSVYKSEATLEALAEFAVMPEQDLPLCHFGLGLYIRNNYLHPDSELYSLFLADGITHMDDMSAVIIREWHETLNGREKHGDASQ